MPHSTTPKVPINTEALIIAMRKKKKSRPEIASALQIHLWQLDGIVGSLIARGLTESNQGSQKATGGRAADLSDPRTKLIIEMKKDHRTLDEISARVTAEIAPITRERVRQILERVGELHGEKILAPDKPVWCVYKASKALRAEGLAVSDATIISICETGTIDYLDRPRQDVKFLITELGMSQLRRHPRTTLTRKCPVCRRKFAGRGKTCGEVCLKERAHRRYIGRGRNPPDPGKMRAVHRAVLRAMPIIGERTEWVVWSKALRVAQITGIQLDYLKSMKIISVAKDREQKWRGKPRNLYSVAEMKVIRPIFAAWRRARDGKLKKKMTGKK